jgi:ketosteroid isomerase-like protein
MTAEEDRRPAAMLQGAMTAPFDTVSAAQRYFDAWNRHDPPGILGLFAEGGTYRDSACEAALTGQAIATCATDLFEALPDAVFEVRSLHICGAGRVAAQWVMGTPPDSSRQAEGPGRDAHPRGADFLHYDEGLLVSAERYFDPARLPGHAARHRAVTTAADPVASSYGTRLHLGRPTRPGAFSLTSLELSCEEDLAELSRLGADIQTAMASTEGVISVTTFAAGNRAYSVTAWEDAEKAGSMLRQPAHRRAMEAFFSGGLGRAGWTSVWVPERLNSLWIRCGACGQVADAESPGRCCPCGRRLPEIGAYW